jgi:hypothetical protein
MERRARVVLKARKVRLVLRVQRARRARSVLKDRLVHKA